MVSLRGHGYSCNRNTWEPETTYILVEMLLNPGRSGGNQNIRLQSYHVYHTKPLCFHGDLSILVCNNVMASRHPDSVLFRHNVSVCNSYKTQENKKHTVDESSHVNVPSPSWSSKPIQTAPLSRFLANPERDFKNNKKAIS